MAFQIKDKVKSIKLPKPKLSKPNISFGWVKRIRGDVFWAILAYIHILVFIPALFQKKDYFVQYHVRQGMALLVVWVLFLFSFFVPVLPWFFGFFILILFISGIVNVVRGKERPLPLVGKIAERY